MLHPRPIRSVCATAILFAGCGGDQAADRHEPLVDTLRSGTIVVQNSEQGLWDVDPGARWTIVESFRIGDSDGVGPDVFGYASTLIVDDLDRIWVADALANELRVFEADGRFVRTVGRRGEGPGEFARIGPVFHGPNSTIWVEDLSLVRWEVFDTAGKRVEGHRSTSTLRGGRRQWTRNGLFLVLEPHPELPGAEALVAYVRTPDGAISREGRVFNLPPEPPWTGGVTISIGPISTVVAIPFTPRPSGALGTDLDYWSSEGIVEDNSYQVHRISLENGDTLLTVKRRFTPVEIPATTRSAAIDSLLEEFRAQGVPSGTLKPDMVPRKYPAFEDIFISATGQLWVRRVFADGRSGFDVFAADGRLLGRPNVEVDLAGMRIISITATSIYGIDTDGLGVNYVFGLAIQRHSEN